MDQFYGRQTHCKKSHHTGSKISLGRGTIKISPFLDLFCFDWLTSLLKLILSRDLNEIHFIDLQCYFFTLLTRAQTEHNCHKYV
jgi:hypothetical protein